LSSAGKLLENKAVDFQLLTIRDGRKNKRISLFSATPRPKPAETKQTPKIKKEKKTGKKRGKNRNQMHSKPDKRE
jgi:hypothetical protein